MSDVATTVPEDDTQTAEERERVFQFRLYNLLVLGAEIARFESLAFRPWVRWYAKGKIAGLEYASELLRKHIEDT